MSDTAELPEEVKLFVLESHENLDQVEQDLITLEKAPRDKELLNRVFRAIHTIKGNSGFLGFSNLESVCHKGEALLDNMRAGTLVLNPALASLLLECVDAIRTNLSAVEETGAEGTQDVAPLLAKFQSVLGDTKK